MYITVTAQGGEIDEIFSYTTVTRQRVKILVYITFTAQVVKSSRINNNQHGGGGAQGWGRGGGGYM